MVEKTLSKMIVEKSKNDSIKIHHHKPKYSALSSKAGTKRTKLLV